MAPLHALCDVAQEFGALTYLDEVHAVGLYGENGGGLSELKGAAHRIDVIEGTLAKAFGVMGGYITGSANLVDFVRSFSSSFIFTTALPPSLTAGALTSLRLIRDGHALRTHLAENAALLKQELAKVELPVLPGPSHIVPVIVGDADLCRAASKLLLENTRCLCAADQLPQLYLGERSDCVLPQPGPYGGRYCLLGSGD